MYLMHVFYFFFFNDTATTEIYTLSLHDALPIYQNLAKPSALDRHAHGRATENCMGCGVRASPSRQIASTSLNTARSEEHTSELQSQSNLVCRLLLEKKNKQIHKTAHIEAQP